MVVMVEEVEWLESSTGVTISITMRGAKLTTVDIVHTDTYIKVVFNYISIRLSACRGPGYPPWISSILIHTSR